MAWPNVTEPETKQQFHRRESKEKETCESLFFTLSYTHTRIWKPVCLCVMSGQFIPALFPLTVFSNIPQLLCHQPSESIFIVWGWGLSCVGWRWGRWKVCVCVCLNVKEERGGQGGGVFVFSQTVSHLPYLWSFGSSLNWSQTELCVWFVGNAVNPTCMCCSWKKRVSSKVWDMSVCFFVRRPNSRFSCHAAWGCFSLWFVHSFHRPEKLTD